MQQQYLTVAQQRLALANTFSSRCPRLRQSSVTMQLYRDTESLVIGSAARIAIEEDMGRLSYTPSGFVDTLEGARLQLPPLADLQVVARGGYARKRGRVVDMR